MKLFKTLNFNDNIVEQIKQATLMEMSRIDLDSGQLHFLRKPGEVLNSYLQQTYPGIPHLFSCILFYRPAGYPQALHLDCNNDDPPQVIDCAINIPILNCDDSYMEWYSGAYNTKVNSNQGMDGFIRKFIELDWKEEPKLLDKTIINGPTLVKVGQPHKISVVDKTRSLITFRFKGNPSFDNIDSLLTQ